MTREYRDVTHLAENLVVRVPVFATVEEFYQWEATWNGFAEVDDGFNTNTNVEEVVDQFLADCYWKTWQHIEGGLADCSSRIITITLDIKS